MSCTTAPPDALLTHLTDRLLASLLAPPRVPAFKVCGCGAVYDATSWRALPYVGVQRLDDEPDLELRNCVCGSTIAVPVPR